MGNLHHSTGNLPEASKSWKEGLKPFLEGLCEPVWVLLDKFTISELFLVAVISSKVKRICESGKVENGGSGVEELGNFRWNGIDMYSGISTKCILGCLQFPHPKECIEYRGYRMTEFSQQIEGVEELITALETTIEILIDHESYVEALPLCCLMEHISVEILRVNSYMIKSRILKIIALAELGYMRESLEMFFKVVEMKDMPLCSAQRNSDYNKQKQGCFFKFTDPTYLYQNTSPPHHPHNKKVISRLLDSNFDISLKYKVSVYLEQYFRFCRCVILANFLEKIPFTEEQTVENANFISRIQNEILEILGVLDKEELVHDYISKLSKYYDVFDKGVDYLPDMKGMSYKEEDNIKGLQSMLTKILATNSKGQIEIDDVTDSPYLYHDEYKPMQFKRSERLALMLKSRLLLSNVYQNITLLKSYYILDQGLMNFHFYAIGKLNSEKCNLYQKKGFEIPAHLGDNIFKIHSKSPLQKQSSNPLLSDQMLSLINHTIHLEKCSLPHAYIWIKCKYSLIKILYLQGRYPEVIIFCDNAKQECTQLGSHSFSYYIRLFDQLLVMCAFQRGYYTRGIEMLKDLKEEVKKSKQRDLELAVFYAGVGEIIYHYDKDEGCIGFFEEAKGIMEEYVGKIGLRVKRIEDFEEEENFNRKDFKFLKPDYMKPSKKHKHLKEELGHVGKSKKLDKSLFHDVVDFDNELFYELFSEDKLGQLKTMENSIYLPRLEDLIKIELRLAQSICIIKQKYTETLEILKYTDRRISALTYPNPYYTYLLNFLKGYCYKMLFYTKLGSFQSSILSLSREKINKIYTDFKNDLPPSGIARGTDFQKIPNFKKKVVQNGWRQYLLEAEKCLKVAVEFTKEECILGEFGIDMTDSVFNLSEVYFLLFEYGEDRIDFMFVDYPNLCVNVPPEKRHEGPLEDCDCEFCRSKIPFAKKIAETQLKSYNYHLKSMEFSLYGRKLLRARNILLDNNFNTGNISTLPLSSLPSDILYDLFSTQKYHQLKFMNSLPNSLSVEERSTYSFGRAKIEEKNSAEDVVISEKDAVYNSYGESYLGLIVQELGYFTFGEERKSKNVCKLHRLLKKHQSQEAALSYAQDCIVPFPEIELVEKALTDEEVEIYLKCKENPWLEFTSKHSDFIYVLQKSPHLVIRLEDPI